MSKNDLRQYTVTSYFANSKHRSMTMSDELKCKECGQTLLSEDELEAHMKQHERASDLFKCAKCKMPFETKDQLERHIQAVHGSSG